MSRLRPERVQDEEEMDTIEEEGSNEDENGGDEDCIRNGRNLKVTKKMRRLRYKFRELIHNVQEEREELIQPENKEIVAVVQQSEKFYREVQGTPEASKAVIPTWEAGMELHFLSLVAFVGKEKATQLHMGPVDFDEGNFCEHVMTFMGCSREAGVSVGDRPLGEEGGSDSGNTDARGRDCDDAYVIDDGTCFPRRAWARLATCASSYMSVVPTFHYMLGTFKADPLPVQCAENRKIRPVKRMQEMRAMPQQLKKLHLSMQEATEQEVERILKILKENIALNGGQPLVFFHFVINPTSFSNTLENIFHTCFLVRDGVVQISLNEDNIPMIGLLKKTGGSTENKQEILKINMETWKELIEVFQIKSSMIPSLSSHSSS